jgi:hypothetical protein
MNKTLKTLLSIPVVIIVGVFAIIEIAFEVFYQLVKLVRRGFKLFTNAFIKLVEPMYKGGWKAKIKDDVDNEIEIITVNYELEESQ